MNRRTESTSTRVAFLDESQSVRACDPNTYMLAAAVCETTKIAEEAREKITALKLKGQVKLHWHGKSPKRRRMIAETIAALPLHYLVVVRVGWPDETSERRRRLCLQRMLRELNYRSVAEAIFESRGRSDDQRDLKMLQTLRVSQQVSPHLRMGHMRGRDEALLWVADALCGAVMQARTGDPMYLDTIKAVVGSQVYLELVDPG